MFPNSSEPFNYHDLLREIGHSEEEVRDPRRPSSVIQATPKSTIDVIQSAEVERGALASLQAARNVIESLEASVSLLQARLAQFEEPKARPDSSEPQPNEEEIRQSARIETTASYLCTSFGPDIYTNKNSSSRERPANSMESGSNPFDPRQIKELSHTALDLVAFEQDGKEICEDKTRTLIAFGAKIRALAAVLNTQSRQIRQLKSANMELAKHNYWISEILTAKEATPWDAQEVNLSAMNEIEKRDGVRREISRKIYIATGVSPPLECQLLDISERGARIRVGAPGSAPQEFLVQLGQGLARWCQVVWRSDTAIGVKFIAPPESLSTRG